MGASLVDFIDNTPRYKGKLITIELMIESEIWLEEGRSLRDWIGRDVEFSALGEQFETLAMVIFVPASLSVPKAGWGDSVKVAFRCKDGDLRHGNEALSVTRP